MTQEKNKLNQFIEIPFGAQDSELQEWTYTIPEGMEAEIKDGKVIIKKKESEDKRIIEQIKFAVMQMPSDREDTKKECLAWLEKQKEQKPVEWSEEDEHRRNDAIYFLETAKKHYADTSEIELTIEWLKSLQPQPHWKPNEKQMDFLKDIINEYKYLTRPKVVAVLQSLYNNLKEL